MRFNQTERVRDCAYASFLMFSCFFTPISLECRASDSSVVCRSTRHPSAAAWIVFHLVTLLRHFRYPSTPSNLSCSITLFKKLCKVLPDYHSSIFFCQFHLHIWVCNICFINYIYNWSWDLTICMCNFVRFKGNNIFFGILFQIWKPLDVYMTFKLFSLKLRFDEVYAYLGKFTKNTLRIPVWRRLSVLGERARNIEKTRGNGVAGGQRVGDREISSLGDLRVPDRRF